MQTLKKFINPNNHSTIYYFLLLQTHCLKQKHKDDILWLFNPMLYFDLSYSKKD